MIVSFLAFGLLLAFTPWRAAHASDPERTLAREGEALTARRAASSCLWPMCWQWPQRFWPAWRGCRVVRPNLQMVPQSPYAIGAVAALFVVLATAMFGLFELQLPTTWVSRMAGGTGRHARGSVGGAAGMEAFAADRRSLRHRAVAAALSYRNMMLDRRECAACSGSAKRIPLIALASIKAALCRVRGVDGAGRTRSASSSRRAAIWMAPNPAAAGRRRFGRAS